MNTSCVTECCVLEQRNNETGVVVTETWLDEKRQPHRRNAPAVRKYCPVSGVLVSELWFQRGVLSRYHDKPAVTKWDVLGNKIYEGFHIEGDSFRSSDKPSHVYYDPESQSVIKEIFAGIDGIGRDEGPAIIEYEKDSGNVTRAEYYFEGEQIKSPSKGPSPQI